MTYTPWMHWRLHVTASTERAASKVAARVAVLLDQRLAVRSIEPYWKIQGQQIVTAELPLHSTTFPEGIVEALTLAGEVAGGWHVTRPEDAADGWRFEGSASGDFRVAGLTFVVWTHAPLPST